MCGPTLIENRRVGTGQKDGSSRGLAAQARRAGRIGWGRLERSGRSGRFYTTMATGMARAPCAFPTVGRTRQAARVKRDECYDAGEMMLAAVGVLLCLAVVLGAIGLRALRTFVRSLWPH